MEALPNKTLPTGPSSCNAVLLGLLTLIPLLSTFYVLIEYKLSLIQRRLASWRSLTRGLGMFLATIELKLNGTEEPTHSDGFTFVL